MADRYNYDILAPARERRPALPTVPATPGLVVEDRAQGFCGAVVGFDKAYDGDYVRLEDRRGAVRTFAMHPGAFLIDGEPVTLVRPAAAPRTPARTASGAVAAPRSRAQVAKASRIFVEGIHDAALVERIWGEDLRDVAITVEPIDGLDNVAEVLTEFAPGPRRRAGILVDHLVTGSKEERLTANLPVALAPHVLVTGHPYIDIWEAVRPEAVGITDWPRIPRGTEWKAGVCRALGWGSTAAGWHRVNAAVHSYRDVRTPLLRAVEELIDFVTEV